MSTSFVPPTNFVPVYKSDFAETYYDVETDCYCFKWVKYSPSNVFREIFEATTAQIAKADSNPNKVFLDSKRIKIIAPTDQIWLVEEWYKKIIDDGKYYRIAFLDSDEIFAKMSIDNVVTKMNELSNKSVAKVFTDFNKAQKWLNAKH